MVKTVEVIFFVVDVLISFLIAFFCLFFFGWKSEELWRFTRFWLDTFLVVFL